MDLQALKNMPYDLIVSLGQNCDPAGNLRRHNLRKFSMPLDWVVSTSLKDVNRLLNNRFAGYMELGNMQQIEGNAQYVDDDFGVHQTKSYFIKDTNYNIISVHDFPVIPGQAWHVQYFAYKKKLTMRIQRLLKEIKDSKSILFIRLSGTYDETVELHAVLRKLTNAEFRILVVHPVNNLHDVIELEWNLPHVCSVQIPSTNNGVFWDSLLNGIQLSP